MLSRLSPLCFKHLSGTPKYIPSVANSLQCSYFHQTCHSTKDKSGSSRAIRPPKQSKFKVDDIEEGEKKEKSEEQKAKLEAKRKERAEKKKEVHSKQVEIQKKRNEKSVEKAVHKKPAV